MDGDLWLSMMWLSKKALDLMRDPRILVHSVITSRDRSEGEFKIPGTARRSTTPGCSAATPTRRRVSSAGNPYADGSICSPLTSTRPPSSRTTPSRRASMLPCGLPGREFVRPHDTPTSLEDPEPVQRSDPGQLASQSRCPSARCPGCELPRSGVDALPAGRCQHSPRSYRGMTRPPRSRLCMDRLCSRRTLLDEIRSAVGPINKIFPIAIAD
jgi:hypothetical protein